MRVVVEGELLEHLKGVMNEKGFSSMKETIEFIYSKYVQLINLENIIKERDEKLADDLFTRFIEKYHNYFVSLKCASSNMEKNSVLMLDAINTILMNEDYETCYPVDFIKSSVIEKSEERYKEKLSNLEQKKDNKNIL